MRITHVIILTVSVCLCPLASADLLWDNYAATPTGWDGATGLSSERDTLISDTWVVDDALFETNVILEEIQWIGFRDDKPLVAADWIIMDTDFNVLFDMNGAEFTRNDLGEQLGRFELYEGSLMLPEGKGVRLEPGRYFIGVRLVGEFLGRNFAATSATGAGNTFGESQAYFKGRPFGFDDWTPVEEVLSSGEPSDFAYRIIGIPEPASLILLALGAAAAFRRRS